jgi:hypothetical protein
MRMTVEGSHWGGLPVCNRAESDIGATGREDEQRRHCVPHLITPHPPTPTPTPIVAVSLIILLDPPSSGLNFN